MSPEILGLVIAIIFFVPTILYLRKKRIEAHAWPLFLATLPIYYMLFGVLAWDLNSVLLELIVGMPYILCGLMVWKIESRTSLIIIAFAWMSHGVYDYLHNHIFVNPGVFAWYPSFCAFVDIAVGVYILSQSQALLSKQRKIEPSL